MDIPKLVPGLFCRCRNDGELVVLSCVFYGTSKVGENLKKFLKNFKKKNFILKKFNLNKKLINLISTRKFWK